MTKPIPKLRTELRSWLWGFINYRRVGAIAQTRIFWILPVYSRVDKVKKFTFFTWGNNVAG